MVFLPSSVRVEVAPARGGLAPVERVALVLLTTLTSDQAQAARSGGARQVRAIGEPPHVLHLRIGSLGEARGLPGLDAGSRLADAARVALTAGAAAVDVVALIDAPPAELLGAEGSEALSEALDAAPEALLLLPDLGCADAASPAADVAATIAAIQTWGAVTRERYQVLLLDLPSRAEELELDLLASALGQDVALCRFSGPRAARHAWRSAAAALGGLLAGEADPAAPLVGRALPLPPGRALPPSRHGLLARAAEPAALDGDPARLALLQLQGDSARVLSDPTWRRPVGAWSLAALRSSKAIHRALREAAQEFVFRGADEAEALSLHDALLRAVSPWTERGVLVGPAAGGAPRVLAQVAHEPGQWGLDALFEARLRPWNQRLRIRLDLALPGGATSREEVA